MAMQFDNTPPEPDQVLKSVPYRTGREGVYHSAGDQVLVKGSSRSYSDVANETANYLANVPNYRAYCKLIEGTELAEYYVQTQRCCRVPSDPTIAERIKERSRLLARPRREVEAIVNQRFATVVGRYDARPEGALYEA